MFQLKDITAPAKLAEMAAEMHQIVSIKMVSDDPAVYEERANLLASLMATSGKALADAKYWKNIAMKESILNRLKDVTKIPASTLNELVKADTHDISYLVDFIEQIDKETKYQMEMLRSLISLKKQEMSYLNYQQA